MSTKWFYMASGWLRKSRRVGPISESDLLAKIDTGHIEPNTLLQSAKTRGQWVRMEKVGPAMARWRKLHPDAKEQREDPKASETPT
ncbi:MAG: DUF4339 domain-containing protein [Planctomycetota bacterium]